MAFLDKTIYYDGSLGLFFSILYLSSKNSPKEILELNSALAGVQLRTLKFTINLN
ncbi:hypothetical protein [Candidatus Midichloria mitochondrii]|uniref:hypothetical protein n=1 Tax=Candidatus Midichloria mitochondrii TaxID=234827 RepID=UPI0003178A5D|nr:hypothetical protein [Candidatus Midichloria mitochondrii]